ncbi:DUF4910 domain-containing protein [Halomonas organivorans]|uniref:Aminopeptidase-like protein n=1 Tax=Halomonas organivorans TaxID=257772 RepID=A0A7W5G4E9_9GAMM|nr:DUF4910 domain-containing protein [Halomonas organivorans]MBB3140059.1 aminopeptidase-like protein [Halomonas organivorans]
MKTMMELLADLTPLNRVICSSDYDYTIEYLKDVLPFQEVNYSAEDNYNGWIIPPKWDVKEASIHRDGELIYDGRWHPMAVMALSAPFRGRVSREELREHLHFDHRYDDRIPFHFRQLFTSWKRDWGFCVPKALHDSLLPGNYDVVIDTEEAAGPLRVLEYHLPGKLEDTIVFGANLDHPGVANDGLSGVVVGMALFDMLRKRDLKFSYRLVLAPGIMGNEYYLGRMADEKRLQLLEGVMLEMLGSPSQLNLQLSRSQNSNIELALQEVINESLLEHRVGEFESLLLNDEYIWEAYDVPMSSLSRFPYPEYHTDADNLSLMDEQRLAEALALLKAAVESLEESPVIRKKFIGNICLSNPDYDLYVDPGQVAFGDRPDENRRRMRKLMDIIPSIKKPTTVRQLAKEVGLPMSAVEGYIKSWHKRGLLDVSS